MLAYNHFVGHAAHDDLMDLDKDIPESPPCVFALFLSAAFG